jgi:hypothetical protein
MKVQMGCFIISEMVYESSKEYLRLLKSAM